MVPDSVERKAESEVDEGTGGNEADETEEQKEAIAVQTLHPVCVCLLMAQKGFRPPAALCCVGAVITLRWKTPGWRRAALRVS